MSPCNDNAASCPGLYQVAEWLRKAHAQHVMIFKPGHEEEQPLAPRATSQHGSGSGSSTGEDAVPVDWVIVATATSQRHAYTCAEAVRFQVRAQEAGVGAQPEQPPVQGAVLGLARRGRTQGLRFQRKSARNSFLTWLSHWV